MQDAVREVVTANAAAIVVLRNPASSPEEVLPAAQRQPNPSPSDSPHDHG